MQDMEGLGPSAPASSCLGDSGGSPSPHPTPPPPPKQPAESLVSCVEGGSGPFPLVPSCFPLLSLPPSPFFLPSELFFSPVPWAWRLLDPLRGGRICGLAARSAPYWPF